MAGINRFDKFVTKDYSFNRSVPKEFIPNFNALDELLGQQQQQYDLLNEISYKVPKHLKQDRPLVEEYVQGVQNDISKISGIYVNQGVSAGARAQRDLISKIKRDYSPGGKADAFQKRLTDYNTIDENLKKTYLDSKSDQYNPLLYKYYKEKIDIEDFETDGIYGDINAPTAVKHYSTEDLQTYYDKVLDNIEADKILIDGTNAKDISGLPFKALLERSEKEFIDWEKVAGVLLNATTPEIIQSAEVYGQASGLGKGQGNIIDPSGNSFNRNSYLGSMLHGFATGKAFEKETDKAKVITKDGALAAYKSSLRKAENDDKIKKEWSLNEYMLRTPVYTNDSGMPELDLKVSDDGVVSQTVGQANSVVGTPVGLTYAGKPQVEQTGFKEFITNPATKEKYPELVAEYDKWNYQGLFDNMSDKQAYDIVQQKYNEKRTELSNTDAVYTIYDQNSKKARSRKTTLIGSTKGPEGVSMGTLANSNQKLIPNMPGVESEPIDFATFAKEYFGVGEKTFLGRRKSKQDLEGLRKLVDGAMVLGEVDSDNSELPAGEIVSFVTPQGDVLTFTVGNKSIQEEALNKPIYDLMKPAYNGTLDRSPATYTFLPNVDFDENGNKRKVQTVAYDRYYSTDLYEKLQDLERAGQKDSIEYEELEEEYQKVVNNPLKNPFRGRELYLTDHNGDELYIDDNGKVTTDEGAGRMLTPDDIKEGIKALKTNK